MADRLKRVFAIDALTCPRCGGRRKLNALLTGGQIVRGILEHLGLRTSPTALVAARSPPEPVLAC